MSIVLAIAAASYLASGGLLAFLMAKPYRLNALDAVLTVLFWPVVILLAAIDGRKP